MDNDGGLKALKNIKITGRKEGNPAYEDCIFEELFDSLTPIFLPSYSPELNSVERFYGEVRKSTANRLFENIEY